MIATSIASTSKIYVSVGTRLVFPILLLLFLLCQPALSVAANAQKKSVSGLPLPRFVSLKANRVNMRVGPGRGYQIAWLFIKKGLPMEIIQEFGNWRKVRDPNGAEGWVLHSLLSGKRFALVTPWDMRTQQKDGEKDATDVPTVNLFAKAVKEARVVAKVEAGALAKIVNCADDWCKLEFTDAQAEALIGFLPQSLLWGVYPDEKVK